MNNFRKIKIFIIIFLVFCSPLMNIIEVKKLIDGSLTNYQTLYTPIYIKLIKDIGIVLLLFIGSFEFLLMKEKITRTFILFSMVLFFPLIISFFYFDKVITLYSLRAILSLFLYPILINIADEKLQNKISKVLLALLFLNISLQIYELLKPITLFGVTHGFSLRSPGFFIIPSSSAAFSIICIYYFTNYLKTSNFKKIILILICIFSVLLTASGTGVLILSALVFSKGIKLENKFIFKFIFLMFLLMVIFLALPKLLSRPDIFISPLTRIKMLKELDLNLFSIYSGLASNTAVLFKKNGAWISDSQYTTMLANLGIVPLLVYFIFTINIKLFSDRKYLDFIIIYFMLGMTLIYLELFPINLIFVINLAYFYREKSNILFKI